MRNLSDRSVRMGPGALQKSRAKRSAVNAYLIIHTEGVRTKVQFRVSFAWCATTHNQPVKRCFVSYAFCICHLLFGKTGGISYADENFPLRNQTCLYSTPPLVCALCCPNDRQRGGVCYPWYGNLPKQRKPKEIITKNDIIKMQWTV